MKKYSLVRITLIVVYLIKENNQFWIVLGSRLEVDSIRECIREHMGTRVWYFSTNRSAPWLDFDLTRECSREQMEHNFWYSSAAPNLNRRSQVFLKFILMRPTTIVAKNLLYSHQLLLVLIVSLLMLRSTPSPKICTRRKRMYSDAQLRGKRERCQFCTG